MPSKPQDAVAVKPPSASHQFITNHPDSTFSITDTNRTEAFANFEKYFHRGINAVDLEIEATCEEIQRVCRMKHLKILDIPYRYCEQLPSEMFDLPQLKMLRLFIPYTITTLPEEISQLQGLSSLTLIGPDLSTLPSSMAKMPMLSKLDLAETNIEELPIWLGEIKTLETILIPDGYETPKVKNLEEFKKANPNIEIL
jgi:Leucine-rich repeat (LRR) protein